MAIWSALFPDVLPQVPGCPSIIVTHELRRAAQEFFERTRAWRADLAATAVATGTSTVTLTPADVEEQAIVRLESAWYDGNRLEVVPASKMDDSFHDDWRSHTGTPYVATQLQPGIVRLYPTPVADSVIGLKASVSLKPADGSTGIPDEIFAKYHPAIVVGAKGALFGYPDKAWRSDRQEKVCRERFEMAVGSAAIDAARAFGRGRVTARVSWC